MPYSSQRKTDTGDYRIISIILIAISFRLVALNKAIFFDEALSLYLARQPLGQMMYYHLKGLDLIFPFFNYILGLWLKITFSLIWARGLSLIFGTLVIYISYRPELYDLFPPTRRILSGFNPRTTDLRASKIPPGR